MDGGPSRRNKAKFFLKISAAFTVMSSDCSLKLWRICCGNLNLFSV